MGKVLLDIMKDGKFVCQLQYGGGRKQNIDGKVVTVYDVDQLKDFVEQCRPSLIGSDYRICFSDNAVLS